MNNNINNQENDESLYSRLRPNAASIILAILIAIAIVMTFVIFARANAREDIPVHDVTAAMTENIPTETSVPVTEETIPVETEETEPVVEETVPPVPEETVHEAPEASVWADTSLKYGYTDRELLAIVIYQEAGGNRTCDECRRRVADVVLNRVMSDKFPDNIHDVLTQYMQYGTLWKTGIQWPERSKNIYEKDAVARAYQIADEILAGQHSELYGKGYIYQAEFKQGSEGMWCCGTYYAR